MFITLIERVVVRCDSPTSHRKHEIISQAQKVVNSYNSDVIPRIGETICLDGGTAYDVVAVLHFRRKVNGVARDEVVLEVAPHAPVHTYNTGSYSFWEKWPLITQLEIMENEE